jgi:alkyl sulfatase BDS1-like metallo-beta-lactamase superfamily hydrolase
VNESVLNVARSVPIRNYIAAMPTNLDAERSLDTDTVMGFRFPDVDAGYTLHVRRGVAQFSEGFPEEADLAITAPSEVWIDVVLGRRGLPAALAAGDVEVKGGVTRVPAVLRFLSLFRPS